MYNSLTIKKTVNNIDLAHKMKVNIMMFYHNYDTEDYNLILCNSFS